MSASFAEDFVEGFKQMLEKVDNFFYNSTKRGAYNLSITALSGDDKTPLFELVYTVDNSGVGPSYRLLNILSDKGVVNYSSFLEEEFVKDEGCGLIAHKVLNESDCLFLDFLIINALEACNKRGSDYVKISSKPFIRKVLSRQIMVKSYLQAYFHGLKQEHDFDSGNSLSVLESGLNPVFLDSLEKVLRVYKPKSNVLLGANLRPYAECVITNLFKVYSEEELKTLTMHLITDFKTRKSMKARERRK